MTQKGFTFIGVLVVIVVFIILTAGGVVVWQRKVASMVIPPPTPSPTPIPLLSPPEPSQKTPPSQGQIYQNTQYGFQFSYPKGWKLLEFSLSTLLASEPGYSAVALWPEKSFPNSVGDSPLTIKIYYQRNDEQGNPVLPQDFFKVPNNRASQITVAGEPAWRFTDNRAGFSSYGAYHDVVVFSHNQYLFMIAGSVKVTAEYDPTFISGAGIMNQILESFVFMK